MIRGCERPNLNNQKYFFQTLTSQIGKIVELEDVDKGIDDYRSTQSLTFEQYRYYLFKEVGEEQKVVVDLWYT